MTAGPIIVWFRQDLRLSDNPALAFAAHSGRPLICLYVLDDQTPGDWKMGGASRWWLHHALAALDGALDGRLALRRGPAARVVTALALAGGWVVIRPLLPRRGRGPACPGCGPGGGTQERRATLTVDGRRVE